MSEERQFIWVFMGERADFPCGVFSERSKAEAWIKANGVSGVLTAYPLDEAVYDWAIANGYFKPKREEQKREEQKTPLFVGRFSSASLEHYHYEDGELMA